MKPINIHAVILVVFLMSGLLNAKEIKIAVAANVSYAIKPLIKAFSQSHPETKVNVILGSSGKLLAQITHGAPYALFMSANMKYPNRLYQNGMTVGKPVIYAQGALAMLSKKERDYSMGLEVLSSEDIRKIAIANPKTAPYGVAAAEALKNAKLYKKLEKKFVYGESISQTVIYATKAADIGLVALSSLYAPQMVHYKKSIHWVEVNEALYTPINQGMVILKHAKENHEVKAFYDFMLSPKAKEILQSFGYRVK
ncbi:Molybdenum ABC transporter, periplasmic molybdenum-binding protein ModA (TC 3.A.1.8.1) [hydrothermal vent metagenome]|uniref:Molybdenum ABC transporter, periplasmic molybdenum-binding protein ModA (TC 3.A.1.8.1) n=1 Tax=hydrothermal vent metagenome TaxID=652676 RepID=A0A1W1CL67_9ZZZZ